MTQSTSTISVAPNTAAVTGFFADESFDFITRMAIGYAAQGVFDVGQVFATIARIQDHDADSWYRAWRATAEKLHARATSELALGHQKTAAKYFLGAAEGYSQANAFADGMTDHSSFQPTFELHRQCWEAFVDASGPRAERVAVPYEGTTMPGYLFKPDDSGASRPTVVMTNGSEGSISGLWAYGVGTALDRGWNAFVYDGPGQQTMLFEKNVPFRPDWEAALTPVVDSIVELAAVDSTALFAYGVSQAGYWLARALAFEHRFVAAVLDPGVMDVSTKWLSHIPASLVDVLKAGKKDVFNNAVDAAAAKDPKFAEALAARGRPFARPTPYDTFIAAMQYNLHDVVANIKTPTLIADPDDETFWPGQPEELSVQLKADHKLVKFSRNDGSNFHCQPMGRIEAETVMFDFFQDRLSAVR